MADGLFAAAVEQHEVFRTPPWIARTHLDWAESLIARGPNSTTPATTSTRPERRSATSTFPTTKAASTPSPPHLDEMLRRDPTSHSAQDAQ